MFGRGFPVIGVELSAQAWRKRVSMSRLRISALQDLESVSCDLKFVLRDLAFECHNPVFGCVARPDLISGKES